MIKKYLWIIFISLSSLLLISCSKKEITNNNILVNRQKINNNLKKEKSKEEINIDINSKEENKTNISNQELKDEKIQSENPKNEQKNYLTKVTNIVQSYLYDANIVSEKLLSYDCDNNGEKIIFLTFDDGPSSTVTPEILKILNKNNVKATFFVTGKSLEKAASQELLKEIFKSGHAIGNHTYSHNYNVLYPNSSLNLNNFISEIENTNNKMKEVLGVDFSTRLIRCPGGFGSWKNMNNLQEYLVNNNLVSIDWNSLSGDSDGSNKNSRELINYAIETSNNKEIVVLLMHDTYGKESTIDSLQGIIDYYMEQGYSFKTLK